MAKGRRAGGGVKMKAARVGGTVSKPRGLKPQQGVSIKPKAAVKPRPKGMSETQRAKKLMAAHREGIIKYEVNAKASKSRLTPKQRKGARKQISATLNKLTPAQQIKVAKNYVGKTRDKRMREAKADASRAATARSVRKANERMAHVRGKIEAFAKNAPAIYADKSRPLNQRKLANAVNKGILSGRQIRGGGVRYGKTEKTNPYKYQAQRTATAFFVQQRRRAEARAARDKARPNAGRQLVKLANAKPFAGYFGSKKQRLPKPVRTAASRIANTIKGRKISNGATAYQAMLQQESRRRTKAMSATIRNPPSSRPPGTRAQRRPAAPRR